MSIEISCILDSSCVHTIQQWAYCSLSQLDIIDEFFAPNGRSCILFYYQEAQPPVSGEQTTDQIGLCVLTSLSLCVWLRAADMKQSGLVPSPSKALEKRVRVTDGSDYPLTGICTYFVRPNNSRPVTNANIVEVNQ